MTSTTGTTSTVTVTDSDFADRVLASDKPVLVEFWAAWCPPCRMLAPVLEQIAAENADVLTVAKVNTDENPGTVTACRVTANPTMQVYRDGELLQVLVGARTKARLLSELSAVLPEMDKS
jgi:thioredoxin 1